LGQWLQLSASRFTAGAFAFFILSHSAERPEGYDESLRLETNGRQTSKIWAP
jgi:hypothetical protein